VNGNELNGLVETVQRLELDIFWKIRRHSSLQTVDGS
jgi:hypothetical protein